MCNLCYEMQLRSRSKVRVGQRHFLPRKYTRVHVFILAITNYTEIQQHVHIIDCLKVSDSLMLDFSETKLREYHSLLTLKAELRGHDYITIRA